ncbi:Pycsar system effector family protein [Micromonospora sp. WMMD998]|uniref:Pycsar system effector family protein n=1 Tax=Micromonospora sp. WMMD998 TaxID=3016092 RepID=UPI00249BBBD5|nr:Pycsar system effector family protein [Micromonospora sp. WMMD998]
MRANLDIAWRSHAAQESWTAKVDTKVSIFLALDGAVLGSVLAARAQRGGAFQQLDGWRANLLTLALVLCAAGAVLAAAAVFPMLGRARRAERRRGIIYFGDLRHREPADLARQLAELTLPEHFDQVARQLVAIARTSWAKHRILQLASALTIPGYVMILAVLAT